MGKDFAMKFYSSKQWKNCRRAYAKSVNHLCERCLKQGIYKPGVIVHHIKELSPMNIDDPEILTGFDNLELLCRDCHAKEHKPSARSRRYFIDKNGKVIAKE